MQIRVMSFNIRYGTALDGAQSWDKRKTLVTERIRAFNPDLLGLQECRADEQAAFVQAALPDYEFIGVPRGGEGDSALEMAAVVFKRDKFDLIASGHFWLSTTPDIPGSKAWGAIFPRITTWVKLQPRAVSTTPLFYLNTHFDYEGTSREESAKLIRQWMTENIGANALIITGDFNADKSSQAYQTLADQKNLFDALKSHSSAQGTFHDYGRATTFDPIDWILISHHFTVQQASVDTYQADGLYPSDHFPITAQLERIKN